jgi:hypothetical protein
VNSTTKIDAPRQPIADALTTAILVATVFTAATVCVIGIFTAWFVALPVRLAEAVWR